MAMPYLGFGTQAASNKFGQDVGATMDRYGMMSQGFNSIFGGGAGNPAQWFGFQGGNPFSMMNWGGGGGAGGAGAGGAGGVDALAATGGVLPPV